MVALFGLLALLAPGVARHAAAAEFYVVVVHEDNPLSSMPAAEVSRLFLRKVERWPDGQPVLPVDLREGSPVRESFSREVHGRAPEAIRAYWQQVIFSGRGVPPPEEDSGSAVVAYVRDHRGAIGYVSVRTSLGAGVKVLKVTH
jgi:ABC-type phosphate transport system substrate-binding protein